MRLTMDIGPLLANEIATAIRERREKLHRLGRPCSTDLTATQELFAMVVQREIATTGDSALARLFDIAQRGEGDGHSHLTRKQVADALGVCERTVSRMVERGDLPTVPAGKRWRVPVEAVEAHRLTNRNGKD